MKLTLISFNENWDAVPFIAEYFLCLKNSSWLVSAPARRVYLLVIPGLMDILHPYIHSRLVFFLPWQFYLHLILCQKTQGQEGTWINSFFLLTKSVFIDSSKIFDGKM